MKIRFYSKNFKQKEAHENRRYCKMGVVPRKQNVNLRSNKHLQLNYAFMMQKQLLFNNVKGGQVDVFNLVNKISKTQIFNRPIVVAAQLSYLPLIKRIMFI